MKLVTAQTASESFLSENAKLQVQITTLQSQNNSLTAQHTALQLANSQLVAEKEEVNIFYLLNFTYIISNVYYNYAFFLYIYIYIYIYITSIYMYN